MKGPNGFTLFFAMLTASLALAVGLAIYDLTARELDLAGAGTQSQYAIYAADLGAECALYWDYNYTGDASGSAFATSSAYTGAAAGADLRCNGQDITTQGPPAADVVRYSGCVGTSPWCVTTTDAAATTTLYVSISSGSTPTYCAVVQVTKSAGPGGLTATGITSRGYNSCLEGVPRYERALQLSY